jgi:hypothetical protein
MAWQFIPTKLRIATHPGGVIAGPRYYNSTQTLHSYLWNGDRVISDKFGYGIDVDGSTSYNNLTSYGGYSGFTGGTYNVWYDIDFGWVASEAITGTPVHEFWSGVDPSDLFATGAYDGDPFYTIGSGSSIGAFPSLGETLTAYGRGSLRGTIYGEASTNTKSITTKWQYWTAPAGGYGEYTAEGEASGTKYLGSPQWKNDSIYFTRSAIATGGHYSYGSITWNTSTSRYEYGNYYSISAPSSGSSWTLSDGNGNNFILSWVGYALGSDSSNISIFRVSKWSAQA